MTKEDDREALIKAIEKDLWSAGIAPAIADIVLAAGFSLPHKPTDEEVRVAVRAYKAPRLHVNDTQIDREIDMYAALEAVYLLRSGKND